MITGMITVIIFTACMLIKGGALGWIPAYKNQRVRMEGAYWSGLILSAFVNPVFGVFWALGNRPRMNDPAGPDWKLSTQRGVFLGACMTFATGLYGDPNIWYILAGALLPWLYRLSIWQTDGQTWVYGEAYLGAALGLAFLAGISA